jgi:hypothetical protein
MRLPLVIQSVSKRVLQLNLVYLYSEDMYSLLNCRNVGNTSRFIRDSYGSMWLPLVMQGVSKGVLQWYSKCYCVATVKKTFTLKGVQIIHRSTPWTIILGVWKWETGCYAKSNGDKYLASADKYVLTCVWKRATNRPIYSVRYTYLLSLSLLTKIPYV